MILILPFLGSRNYLHGTTLLEALLEHTGLPFEFVFKITHPIFSNRVEFTTKAHVASAFFTYGKTELFVKEIDSVPPLMHEEFDEKYFWQYLQTMASVFNMPIGISGFPVRAMVAAFKHILLSFYPVPDAAGHWAFIRLDAKQLQYNTATTLSLGNIFCRNTMANCTIHLDNHFAGTLYFSWVKF